MTGQMIRKGRQRHVCSGMPHVKSVGWMAVWRCECGAHWVAYTDDWLPAGPFFYIGLAFRKLVHFFGGN